MNENDEDKIDFVSEEDLIPDSLDDEDSYSLIKKLRGRIKELETKNQEYLLGWQKERAEGINLRKRLEEEKREFARFAKEDMVLEIIPVLDSFESAFKNKESWEKVDKNWRQGVEYIYNQLKNIILSSGVSVISPLGDIFDPERDEAVENVSVSDKSQDHKVVEVLNVGYKLGERTIRAPKVKVAVFKD